MTEVDWNWHCYTMQSAFPKELMYIFYNTKGLLLVLWGTQFKTFIWNNPESTNHIIPYNTNSAQPKAKWSKLQYLSLPPWLACKCEKEWGFYCNRHKQIQCYKWVTFKWKLQTWLVCADRGFGCIRPKYTSEMDQWIHTQIHAQSINAPNC